MESTGILKHCRLMPNQSIAATVMLDNQNRFKKGASILTSTVNKMDVAGGKLRIHTRNSVYEVEGEILL